MKTLSPLRLSAWLVLAWMVLSHGYCLESRAQDFLHEAKVDRDARMKWWREARFGLFIHWGLYSVPAGEWNGKTDYGEWIRNSAHIPLTQYDDFVHRFNPVKFNARQWVRMAKNAGMKYIVITSKHHDGFCMFDSRYTEFNIMNTPFHRDALKELAAACREEGLKICFYYSIMDWHHPDYLPRREWETDRPAEGASYERYVQYLKNQLKELLTNYGDIGVLWFDGEWESTWNHEYGNEIYNYVRTLEPDCIINNRVGAGRTGMEGFNQEGEFAGDFGTPEQEIPATGLPDVDWETCMTMNDHWGYNKADNNFKSSKELIRMLVDIASKGGNFLLNVGPTSEGLFPPLSVDRLNDIGAWMKSNGESIYGTVSSPFSSTSWGRCTRKQMPDGSVRLYFHLFEWPAGGVLRFTGLGTAPIEGKVFMLQQPGKPLQCMQSGDTTTVALSHISPDTADAVMVMEFKQDPLIFHPPIITASTSIFLKDLDVTITGSSPGTTIRYTLDGSDPGNTSARYTGPVHLTETAVVKAQSFYKEARVSDVVMKEITKVRPAPSVGIENFPHGVRYSYFEGNWDSLPAYNSLHPVEEGITPRIDLQMRKRNEYFGMRYTGYLVVPGDDVYHFALTSDDGSRLWVGDEMVVDNDGLHGSSLKDGFIALSGGAHPFRIDYFNKTGGSELLFQVAAAGQKLSLPREESFLCQP